MIEEEEDTFVVAVSNMKPEEIPSTFAGMVVETRGTFLRGEHWTPSLYVYSTSGDESPLGVGAAIMWASSVEGEGSPTILIVGDKEKVFNICVEISGQKPDLPDNDVVCAIIYVDEDDGEEDADILSPLIRMQLYGGSDEGALVRACMGIIEQEIIRQEADEIPFYMQEAIDAD